MEFPSLDTQAGERITHIAYAVPLLAGERYLGCLYLDGPEYALALDSSDRIFLNALASQVALALDRADLAARYKEETEREHQRLREEVQELRQVVTSARLVYRSREMQTLLDTLRSVAPTDVTILINGESGTGKEMLARSVHEMGSRKHKPLVTVDCGAIANNLIEAELFGHVKGAYTGADSASAGRIVQADGGTLFLDEIGEIPLDVQAKFLRFVQEKEINPVGASTSRHVDVRIVAATNRDLAAEVAAGRFREDLFYRLKVVMLTAPPLRERPTDILPLAKHFLEKFALQYEKGIRRFTTDAERHLQDYPWPGNVRELQNSILRAVVLSGTEQIDTTLLPFDPAREVELPDPVGASDTAGTGEQPGTPPDTESRHPEAESTITGDPGDPWQALQQGLAEQVEAALANRGEATVPLGNWLTEDLLQAADDLAWGVARRAAARLGVAETTYRRQFEKLQRAQSQGLLQRNPNWAGLQPLVPHLVKSLDDRSEDNILEKARQVLLGEVTARATGNDKLGAHLMGVTVPTYRRWSSKT
jgi:transcriptional regulator with GAF, ATPase, and Fis domain